MATGPYVRRIVSVYDGGKVSREIEFNVDIVVWKYREYLKCLGKDPERAEEEARYHQERLRSRAIDKYQGNDSKRADNLTKSIYLMQCIRDGKKYSECLSSFAKTQNIQEDSGDSEELDSLCRHVSGIEDNDAIDPWTYFRKEQEESPWSYSRGAGCIRQPMCHMRVPTRIFSVPIRSCSVVMPSIL